MISSLHSSNLQILSQVYVKSRLNSPWKSSSELGLDGSFVEEWNGYVLALNCVGICLSYHQDTIVWDWDESVGQVLAKIDYNYILSLFIPLSNRWWKNQLWKWKVPTKLSCFIWLCLENKSLTWDNLVKHRMKGHGICVLCLKELETASHIFGTCSFFRKVWNSCQALLNFKSNWFGSTFQGCLKIWINKNSKFRDFPLYIFWEVWKTRN